MRRNDRHSRAPRAAPTRRLPALLTLAMAGLLSVAWTGLVWRYVGADAGWAALRAAPPETMAVFLAATAGPLAALWLVAAFILTALALFQTQADVRLTLRQTTRTTDEIEALVRTSIEMQEQSRRQSFLNGVELALKDLNSQAGMITGRLGVLSAEETEYLWALNAAGDPWAFCHALLERSELEDDFIDLVAHRVAGDEVASAGLHRFLRRYERLLALAKEYDVDKLVREVLEDGPLDRLYTLFQVVSARVQAMMAPVPPSGRRPGSGDGADGGYGGYDGDPWIGTDAHDGPDGQFGGDGQDPAGGRWTLPPDGPDDRADRFTARSWGAAIAQRTALGRFFGGTRGVGPGPGAGAGVGLGFGHRDRVS
jgi:hypothetical protein